MYYNRLEGNYDFDLNNFLGLPSTGELYNYDFASNFLGAFWNYRIERAHTIGSFTVLSDLQGRYTEFRYIGDEELPATNWALFNPKAGVTYAMTKASDLYYSVGRTGREPTRNDILVGNDNAMVDENGVVVLGPTSAEQVVDHELGIRTHGKEWQVKANTFYMDFDKEIVLNGEIGPNGLPLTQSVGTSYRTGLELEHAYTVLPGLTLYGSGAYTYARMSQQGESFTPVITPRWVVNQGAQYSRNRFRARVDLRYQSSAYIDFANTTSLNSYMTTDLLCGYSFGDVALDVSLNNIFSERYFTNGYIDYNGDARYFIQAPRNIFVSLTWKL